MMGKSKVAARQADTSVERGARPIELGELPPGFTTFG